MKTFEHTDYYRVFAPRLEVITKTLRDYINLDSDVLKQSEIENVYYIDNDESGLGRWTYPIVIGDKVFVDARPFFNDKNVLRDRMNFGYSINRALLELVWHNDHAEYASISGNVAAIYSSWLTQSLLQRYRREVTDEYNIQIALFIYCLVVMLPPKQRNLDEVIVKKIARYTRIPNEFVENFLELEVNDAKFLDVVDRSHEFSSFLPQVLEFVNATLKTEIENLTVRSLGQSVVYSWMGEKELVGPAIQHPPILVEFIHRAKNLSTYLDKTIIGKVIKSNRAAQSESIEKFVSNLLASERRG